MSARLRQGGFSIAEVLIAVGVLAVAMILIAGVFPVGIRFTQLNIDKTMGAIIANEAFAKIQLYAREIRPNLTDLRFDSQRDFNDLLDENTNDYLLDVNEYCYPTDNSMDFEDKQYFWSALCRSLDRNISDPNFTANRDVQVTVFICRKPEANLKYVLPNFETSFQAGFSSPSFDYGRITTETADVPRPVKIEVREGDVENELEIVNDSEKVYINKGAVLVEDQTGRIYRVMERYPVPDDDIILLDKDFVDEDWQGQPLNADIFVWVVAPPVEGLGRSGWRPTGGRSPCVGVYQRVIRF